MRRRHRQDEEDWVVTVDLEQLNPDMSVAELQEVASLHKVYMRYRKKSQLTPEGWAYVLGISEARERAYASLNDKVPNSVMNKALKAYTRLTRVKNQLHNEGL